MKNLDLDYVISDKFLMEVKRKLKYISPDDALICSKNCPLVETGYAGICISWMNKVLGSRNITNPYERYMPKSCNDLFSYVFKHALIDVNKKQNKI